MSLFSALVKTVINVAVLPVTVVGDALTPFKDEKSYTMRQLEKLKEESEG
mgnify:CR=1 FL=1